MFLKCTVLGTSVPYTRDEIYMEIVYNWNLLFYLVIELKEQPVID